MSERELTFYERLAIQMEYAVPLIRGLQRVLGEEAVNAALDQHSRDDLAAAKQEPKAEADMRAFGEGAELYAAGDALDYEVLREDDERFEMNVTRCAYAELMERLGAREIGHLLICNADFAMAERAGVTLERTQTRMQGAPFCDFRFRKRKGGS